MALRWRNRASSGRGRAAYGFVLLALLFGLAGGGSRVAISWHCPCSHETTTEKSEGAAEITLVSQRRPIFRDMRIDAKLRVIASTVRAIASPSHVHLPLSAAPFFDCLCGAGARWRC